ncbi:MAG: hypothetical protein HC780_03625 [Leptolyngbyaceae cyanobacterium CSU_1_3]|nr:hypothetical protein [Leptolyngbyaceae cyanobacterium CSU_1_3]
MKGDFTRSTFRPQNHYSSVRMQQGRLQLDADWNEQIDIQRHLLQMQARDMLGTSGVPMADLSTERSFQIDVIENGKDLAIAPGRMYIDGILCELEPGSFLSFDRKATSEPDRTEIEVSTLLVDGQNLAPQQWIEIFSADQTEVEPRYRVRIAGVDPTPRLSGFTITLDRSSIELKSGKLRRILTLNTQPDYPQPDAAIDAQKSWVALTQGKSYLVYMDVWQRHLTAIEAPNIRESALNLPDTTTRNKTVWQVKLLELEPDKDIKEQWNASLKVRNATLKARANPTFSNGGANSSLRRLENQLYRIEIHTPGKAGQATFKWSRDNGTIVSAIENLDDTTNIITIAQPSRDVSQLFAPNQWVEISDNVRDLNGLPGTLVRLTADTSGTKLVFQKAKDRDIVNLSQFPKAQKPKVRRWDHTTSTAEIPTVVHKWLPLDNEGIEVWFDDNSDYQTGDYWFIPARTVTNDIEWLQDDFRNPLPQAIAGTYHAYGCLAVLKYEQDQLTVVDDRNPFPALANCLPKSGGTITGSLTIQDSLTVKQRLTANQLTSETFTINSGKINSPINLFLQTSDQNQLSIIHETGNIGIGITDPKLSFMWLHQRGHRQHSGSVRAIAI